MIWGWPSGKTGRRSYFMHFSTLFSDISANEHQKWKHKKMKYFRSEHEKRNIFFVCIYIYMCVCVYLYIYFAATNYLLDADLWLYISPHREPWSFRASFISNRRNKSQKYSMHIYFHTLFSSACSTVWCCLESKPTSRSVIKSKLF